MKRYTASVEIMPLEALLDPQGKAIKTSLHQLKLKSISDVRIGKHCFISLEAEDEDKAVEIIKEACEKLLANKVMETFTFTLMEII